MPLVLWGCILIELALSIKYGEAWADFGVLCGLQFINGTVSFYESHTANNAVAALKAALKPYALVRRDGEWKQLEAAVLVPGDIVKLEAGRQVPADCEVVTGTLQVDQSGLTGESQPVAMQRGARPKMGSTITGGEAEARVTETGCNTFIGKTASLIGSVDQQPRFSKVLLRLMFYIVSISLAVCVAALGFLLHTERETVETALGVTVIILVVSIPVAIRAWPPHATYSPVVSHLFSSPQRWSLQAPWRWGAAR